jgi:hypothetical protein
MRISGRSWALALAIGVAVVATGGRSWARAIPPKYHKEPYQLSTGAHGNARTETTPPFQEIIVAPGAPWVRLHIGQYHLGEKSYVTFTSTLDGGRQRLDAKSLPEWYNSTAIFNGDVVLMELHVAPGEENIFVQIRELTVGEWTSETGTESICGATDDRAVSADPAVGRLFFGGCTAWLVSNGTILTAGHCTDFDPDSGGPLLPDGVIDLSGVVEFNVPLSLANGTVVAAAPNDQYPISLTNVQFNFDGEGQGLGKDWSVFRCNANANTGLLPHIARNAYYRMTRELPAVGNNIRVTGYGIDDAPAGTGGGENQWTRTEQTHIGPFQGESSAGANFWVNHRSDTRGASSGSPIIWEANNQFTIGIHTNAGCDATPGSANAGTSFEHDPLENGLDNYYGANVVHCDTVTIAPAETGNVLQPYNTVAEAAAVVVNGGSILIVKGTYTAAAGNTFTIGTGNKAVNFIVPVGTVTIGE